MTLQGTHFVIDACCLVYVQFCSHWYAKQGTHNYDATSKEVVYKSVSLRTLFLNEGKTEAFRDSPAIYDL